MRRFVARSKKRVVTRRKKQTSSEVRRFIDHRERHKSSNDQLQEILEAYDPVIAGNSGSGDYKCDEIPERCLQPAAEIGYAITKLAHLKEDVQRYQSDRAAAMATLTFFQHGLSVQLEEVNWLNNIIEEKFACVIDLVTELEQLQCKGCRFQAISTDSDQQVLMMQNGVIDKNVIDFQDSLQNDVSHVKCDDVLRRRYENHKQAVILTRRGCSVQNY